MYKISAVFIGILIAIMVTFNGLLVNYTNQYRSILIIHIIGLMAITITLILRTEKFKLTKNIPI